MLTKNLLLPIILFANGAFLLNAQNDFSVEPEMFEELLISEDPLPNNFFLNSSLINTASNELELNWKLVNKDVPEEWQISVADTEIEYFPGIEESPNPFFVPGLETDGFFGIFINSQGVNECGSFSIEFLDAISGDLLLTVPYDISINNEECFLVSANEIELSKISITPNPASNFVNISHDNQIVSVSIFSVAGDLIFENNQFLGNRLDISQWPSGVYVMKFEDANKNVHLLKQVICKF